MSCFHNGWFVCDTWVILKSFQLVHRCFYHPQIYHAKSDASTRPNNLDHSIVQSHYASIL
uniref:Uncharacterized protein n=1 Tax=Arundo donax TaxID=35708 RepID=A0A0A9DV70_ARUDO